MAKLTLFFNNTPIDTFHLEEEVSTIGRAESNTFIIDSLAIAPEHLKITLIADDYFIESLSEQFPTFLNSQPVQREKIQHADSIQIGKHSLSFSHPLPRIDNEIGKRDTFDELTTKKPTNNIDAGHLQSINGTDIGLVMSLNKAVNEIKVSDTVPAIIAKRHDGYYISRLMDNVTLAIADNPITSETKLEENSVLHIGDNKYLFFIE